MKILFVPLSAMANTAGSYQRVNQLATCFYKHGVEVVLCAARDQNYRLSEEFKVNKVKSYEMPVPAPLGLPACIGKYMFPIASKTGIAAHKEIKSFDQVLWLTGAISKRYFTAQVQVVQEVIAQEKPDYVYSEFNIAAIVAAKIKCIPCLTDYSFPVQHEYAHNTQYAKEVNAYLSNVGLPQVTSVLQILEWADRLYVPSVSSIEPIQKLNIIFTGPFGMYQTTEISSVSKRRKVLVYMGNGCISTKRTVKVISECAKVSDLEFYVSAPGWNETDSKNLHIAPWFDFSGMMQDAVVYIHHGGQNGCMDAILHGTPQIICSGNMFERKYNGEVMKRLGLGEMLDQKEFTSDQLCQQIQQIRSSGRYQSKIEKIREELIDAGGAEHVVKDIM